MRILAIGLLFTFFICGCGNSEKSEPTDNTSDSEVSDVFNDVDKDEAVQVDDNGFNDDSSDLETADDAVDDANDLTDEDHFDEEVDDSDADSAIEIPYCVDGECLVPEGPFMMGCTDEMDNEMYADCKDNAKPYHEVYLSEYKIDEYEVTITQYQECVDAGDCVMRKDDEYFYLAYDNSLWIDGCFLGDPDLDPNLPMNCVSWFGARQYCEWLGKRLPTEAEWEKAARGTDERVFPWGNVGSCDKAVFVGYYDEDLVFSFCEGNEPFPVGSKPAGKSPYGAYDMAGNVFEWVNDIYLEDYYDNSPKDNPKGPEFGQFQIFRGGGFGYADSDAKVFVRFGDYGGEISGRLGFRCVR